LGAEAKVDKGSLKAKLKGEPAINRIPKPRGEKGEKKCTANHEPNVHETW